MLSSARAFFAKRGVLEIDCGALLRYPPIDSHIDCISTDQGFLHTSPEYALKKLLSQGIGDCYFLGHVYRKEETGKLHNPEFTMVEWYRLNFSLEQMIQETADFLALFVGEKPIRLLPYAKAFEQYLQIDYRAVSLQTLHNLTQSSWDRSTCIHYLLTHKIEPFLGRGEFTVLCDFPPYEAALACVIEKQGQRVAERFEFYCEGIELTNGYHELADAKELKKRFETINSERIIEGKSPYPIDESFLQSLSQLPDCCGVALGFDRAMMLRHGLSSIEPVIPYATFGRSEPTVLC